MPHRRNSDRNNERRANIRADLDASIAERYGLTRTELRYILDPPDIPDATFRALKEIKHIKKYRTQRLVLAAWDWKGNQ